MTGRSLFRSRRWRVLRWAGLAAAVPALWACNSRSLEPPIISPTSTYKNTFQETINRKIDILFMIDNSSSMELSQANLVRNLTTFMNVLKGLPDGLPDVHIAVVTSDMGAGDGSITGCGGNGNGGVFQFSPRTPQGGTACTDTTLQNGAHYIADTGGAAPQTNFTAPDITTVFQCIAPVGASGCGFEHQLASVARALGADGPPGTLPPQENQDFLRDSAYLAIIFITNEDDCSAPVGSMLFDTSQNTNLASAVGPPGNFRCNEFGHTCSLNGAASAAPARLSPMPTDLTQMVSYDNCVSSETTGLLTPIAQFAQGIKGLKADPASQILVASIQGPVTPYTVHWTAPPTSDTGPWPSIEHSCTATDSSFADPGVRMQQFVQQFGGNGLTTSICADNFGPALNTIAMKLSALIGPKCIVGTVATRSGSTTMPDCTVTDVVPNASGGGNSQSVVAACADNGNTPPCWDLVAGSGMMCNGSHVITINRGGVMPADNLRNAVECSMCLGNPPVPPDPTRSCL